MGPNAMIFVFWTLSFQLAFHSSFTFITVGFPGGSDGKASACNEGLIPGSGRSPGEGNGNPFQYSCLENPMYWGAWESTVTGRRVGHDWVTLLLFPLHQEAPQFLFAFCHKSDVICISEVIDISPDNLDYSLCFIKPGISHDVLCI